MGGRELTPSDSATLTLPLRHLKSHVHFKLKLSPLLLIWLLILWVIGAEGALTIQQHQTIDQLTSCFENST
jgi:hypothetical protein